MRRIERRLPNFIRAENIKRFFSIGRENPPSWWYPSLSLVAGLVLGAVLGRFTGEVHPALSFLTYNGGAEAARSFVTLAATSLATITTLTLSLTVISLQLASSQYSPRLIEHYLNDRGNHVVFSLFLGTFAFAIATLLNIRLPSDDPVSAGRVPSIAVAVLVALLVACLVALVLFVHRVTSSMQVESILQRVRDRTLIGIDSRAERRQGESSAPSPPPDSTASPIRSRRSGYFAALDWDAVHEFQPDEHCDVWIVVPPGRFVTEGTPVALVSGEVSDELADEVESWLRFDEQRWIESDVAYGVRSLVDVALRALSPGVNDPTTATMAIARLGETLARAGASRPTTVVSTDAGVRISIAAIEWPDLLQRSVRQIAVYGASDIEVVVTLVQMLNSLAWAHLDESYRSDVEETAGLLRTWIDDGLLASDHDRARIEAEFDRLADALGRQASADASAEGP